MIFKETLGICTVSKYLHTGYLLIIIGKRPGKQTLTEWSRSILPVMRHSNFVVLSDRIHWEGIWPLWYSSPKCVVSFTAWENITKTDVDGHSTKYLRIQDACQSHERQEKTVGLSQIEGV